MAYVNSCLNEVKFFMRGGSGTKISTIIVSLWSAFLSTEGVCIWQKFRIYQYHIDIRKRFFVTSWTVIDAIHAVAKQPVFPRSLETCMSLPLPPQTPFVMDVAITLCGIPPQSTVL